MVLLVDKCYGKYIVTGDYEPEIYCKECGYEGELSFDDDREYGVEKIDCFQKEEYEYLMNFIKEVDCEWKNNTTIWNF